MSAICGSRRSDGPAVLIGGRHHERPWKAACRRSVSGGRGGCGSGRGQDVRSDLYRQRGLGSFRHGNCHDRGRLVHTEQLRAGGQPTPDFIDAFSATFTGFDGIPSLSFSLADLGTAFFGAQPTSTINDFNFWSSDILGETTTCTSLCLSGEAPLTGTLTNLADGAQIEYSIGITPPPRRRSQSRRPGACWSWASARSARRCAAA